MKHLLVIGIMAVILAPGYPACAETQLTLGDVMALAASSSPVVVSAKEDLASAVQALEVEMGRLGLTVNISTDKVWRAARVSTPVEATTLELDTRLQATKALMPGHTASLTVSPLSVKMSSVANQADTSFTARIAWAAQLTGDPLYSQPYVIVRERERAVVQRELMLESARRDSAISAARAFIELVKAGVDIEASRAELRLQRADLDRISFDLASGKALAIDLELAKARVRSLESSVALSEARYRADKAKFLSSLGMRSADVDSIQLIAPPRSSSYAPKTAAELALMATNHRPEIALRLIAIEAATDKVKSASGPDIWMLTPNLSYRTKDQSWVLGADLSKQSSATGSLTGTVAFEPSGPWSVTLAFSRTLGGLDETRKKELEIQSNRRDLEKAIDALEDIRSSISVEVADLLATLEHRALLAEVRRMEYELELTKYQVALEKKELHLATESDLQRAGLSLLKAEAAAVKADYDMLYSLLAVIHSTGAYDPASIADHAIRGGAIDE